MIECSNPPRDFDQNEYLQFPEIFRNFDLTMTTVNTKIFWIAESESGVRLTKSAQLFILLSCLIKRITKNKIKIQIKNITSSNRYQIRIQVNEL